MKKISTSKKILRKKASQIIKAGLNAIQTKKIIRNELDLKKNILYIRGRRYDLRKYADIYVIGFGKSSAEMAQGIEKTLKNRIKKGIVISNNKTKLQKIRLILGSHPLPSNKNKAATNKIIDLLASTTKKDLVLCLISGGGSSLLCYPNIPLERYAKIIKKAYISGIDIKDLNKIRKRYSLVKDGKLPGFTKAKIISLIFSDVIGDDLSVIASGPTYKKGIKNVDNILLLNNRTALEAMKEKARSIGLKPAILTDKLKGEARSAGKKLIKKALKDTSKNCFLFAGETTVKVEGKGKGGRNQELCLGAIEEASRQDIVLASLGTDGIDGNTDAAGAIIDNNSLSRAEKLNMDYKKYLKDNNSYNFFRKLDDLIFTGKTGSNIADIGVMIKVI